MFFLWQQKIALHVVISFGDDGSRKKKTYGAEKVPQTIRRNRTGNWGGQGGPTNQNATSCAVIISE